MSSAFSFILLSNFKIVMRISSLISNSLILSCIVPASILASCKSSVTRRASLFVSSSTILRYVSRFSGGIVPSMIPSTKPEMVVIGVRSSCETFAIKLERISSRLFRLSTMALKFAESSAISLSPSVDTLTSKFPFATAFAALFKSIIGFDAFLE